MESHSSFESIIPLGPVDVWNLSLFRDITRCLLTMTANAINTVYASIAMAQLFQLYLSL